MGIIVSAIIHVAVLLLLLFFREPVIAVTPGEEIIRVILEQPGAIFPDTALETKQPVAFKVNKRQNNVVSKIVSPLPVKEEVLPERTVGEKPDIINEILPAEIPAVVEGSNAAVAGSTNAENQSDKTTKASDAMKTEGRGIAESQFGEVGAPVFIHREMPVYPMLARQLGKEGKVVLKLLIDRNGKLQSVEVVESAGFGFAEAVIAAVKKSTYAAASRNGEKIAMKALLPVRFHLQ